MNLEQIKENLEEAEKLYNNARELSQSKCCEYDFFYMPSIILWIRLKEEDVNIKIRSSSKILTLRRIGRRGREGNSGKTFFGD